MDKRAQKWTQLRRMQSPLALMQTSVSGMGQEKHHGVCHSVVREISSKRKVCEDTRFMQVLGLWTVPREVKSLKIGGFS